MLEVIVPMRGVDTAAACADEGSSSHEAANCVSQIFESLFCKFLRH